MNTLLLVTVEILAVVVTPLLILYLRGSWRAHSTIPYLFSIPILWYLTYAPIHELSHLAGAYLVGAEVTSVKLIPSFWIGEFGRAWITPVGIEQDWERLTMTGAPYILDIVSVLLGILVLRQDRLKNPFMIGLLFMLLCLRPAFDFVCETMAFLMGDQGDLYHIEVITGDFMMASFVLISIGVSFLAIITVLRRFSAYRH